MCIRILAAAGLGSVMGIERARANKPAGLRTHLLVCMAAALATASALLIGDRFAVPADALRVAAGVLTGVGFVGAGTILHTRENVVGLTTAATVFMAAAVGIAVGGGFYYLSVTAVLVTVFSNWALHLLDRASRERPANDGSPSGVARDPDVGRDRW